MRKRSGSASPDMGPKRPDPIPGAAVSPSRYLQTVYDVPHEEWAAT